MVITKSQRMMLQYFKDIKDTGPSLIRGYKLCWKCLLFLVFIIIVFIFLDYKIGLGSESYVFYGMIFGAFIRDLGIKRKQKVNWNVHKEIINWDKVNELIDKKNKHD